MASGIASLDKLHAAFGDLRRALDTYDAAKINAAAAVVKAATEDVRAQGAWTMDPALRQKIEALRPLIESARVRVNLASDDVRQKIALLTQSGADGMPLTYGR
ncbi:MAG: hypothetical protein IT554_08435 [Sphingomonadaceae bacterium]|nr:hypothetical protein [Sphingomonadaceae bacterium]